MVKAQELRIGNYILLEVPPDLPRPHRVMAQDIADISNGRITLSLIQPIPLTPELLEKCGFENGEVSITSENRNLPAWTKGITIAQADDGFRLWIDIEEDGWYSFSWTKVESLHQLQNLYFALIGEELEVKLTSSFNKMSESPLW